MHHFRILSYFLLLFCFSLISCKKEPEVQKETKVTPQETKKETPKKSEALTLEPFGFPSSVSGCSCYFSSSREEFVKQNYLYVDDYQKEAYVNVNGKEVRIPLKKAKDYLPTSTLLIEAENKEYKLKLEGRVVEEGEIETMLYRATLTLENSQKQKIQIPLYGECGC